MNRPPLLILSSFVRSLLWWIIFFCLTVFYSVFILLLVVVPYRLRYRLATSWGWLNIQTLRWICGVRYRIEGLEHLPDSAAIVLSNHQSTWETLAYSFIFPPQVWVLKKSLLNVPFFGWGLAVMKPIAIDRAAGSSAMEQVVQQGRDRLDAGVWVVVFPEGTRVAPGKKRRYKMGGAVLAAATGYPVIPVAHNAGLLWARHQFIKYPGEVTVSIGPPIDTEGLTAEAINQRAETWIETRKAELGPVYTN